MTGGGTSQRPFVQLEEQQSAPVVQVALAAAQTVTHVLLAGSQWLEQQSPSAVHVAFWPRHAPGGSPQRPSGSQRSSSLVAPQQPDCGPLPQSSPVGRHREFARSTLHCFVVGSQTPEQQSEFSEQVSPTIAQSLSVQIPPKHPREQQSWAVAQATPFARHASLHWMTPASPVTGSQRPLQQSGPIVQAAAGALQLPPPPAPSVAGPPPRTLPTQTPLVHVPEQQSKPVAHAPAAPLHALAGAAPGPESVATTPGLPPHTFPVQAPTQQSEGLVHPAPIVEHEPAVPMGPPPGPPKVVLAAPSAPASPPRRLELLPPQQTRAVAAAAIAPRSIALGPVFVRFMTCSFA